LEDAISLSVVNPVRDERGWAFNEGYDDPVNGFKFLSEAHLQSDPIFEGRYTSRLSGIASRIGFSATIIPTSRCNLARRSCRRRRIRSISIRRPFARRSM